MLPFFRKIRWQLARDNQFIKYSRYAFGEIVLVVIGILIALQINNWNEEKKNDKKELFYLKGLLRDYYTSLWELDRVIQKSERIYRFTDSLIKISVVPIEKVQLEKLDSMIFYSTGLTIYTPSTGIMDEIIGSGYLSLIKNDSIRSAIAEKESGFQWLRAREEFFKENMMKYMEYMEQHQTINPENRAMYLMPDKKKVILNDPEFGRLLSNNYQYFKYLNALYLSEREKTGQMIGLIIRELKAKKVDIATLQDQVQKDSKLDIQFLLRE